MFLRKFMILVFSSLFLFTCKTSSNVGASKIKDATNTGGAAEEAGGDYLTGLNSVEDFNRFALTSNDGYTSVKYTYELKSDAKSIYFQDTKKYDYHYPFLINEVEKYKSMTSSEYETMIRSADQRELAAGAVYFGAQLKTPEYTEPGLIGYTVYYSVEGDMIRVEDITATFNKIKESVSLAKDRVVYVFDNKADYFKFKVRLKAAGIPSVPVERFKQQ